MVWYNDELNEKKSIKTTGTTWYMLEDPVETGAQDSRSIGDLHQGTDAVGQPVKTDT